MPMPRDEDDDDLFHSVDDVEFADDAGEEKKPAKKKTAKKVATKKAVIKKTVKKKTIKKKVKRVSVSADEDKPAPRKRRKKVIKAEKPAEESFGAGLFDSEAEEVTEERTEEKTEKAPEKKAPARRKRSTRKPARAETAAPAAQERAVETPADEPQAENQAEAAPKNGEKTDEYGRTEPVANYVVHVYEFGRLKRTIDRNFTPELAEAYVTEFCRTSKRYGRQAVAGKKDTQPAKELEGEQDLLDRSSAPGAK